jgi:predicted metal-dependent HD superfamily phosphohydrolase
MWSKLIGDTYKTETSVQIIAKEYYDRGGRVYHNWRHILDCYDYLEKNSVAYDADLDYAVMHHDIVYDNQPYKELRSAELMLKWYPSRKTAAEIIMSTADHNIASIAMDDLLSIHMIKADLHQLADPAQSTRNYVKIMDESIGLYGITPLEFATGNATFMMQLQLTILANMQVDADHDFWDDVRQGIDHTIAISQSMKKLGKLQ